MKLSMEVAPRLATVLREAHAEGERAVTEAMRDAGTGLKTDWRRQVTGAGLGERLARSVRSEVYPRATTSLEAAALVWTKAPEILGAFDRGALIRGRAGQFLAIPTESARATIRRGRLTPAIFERRTGLRLRFVYRRNGPSLLVTDDARVSKRGGLRANVTRRRDGTTYSRLAGRASAVVFLLVPQVRLRRRLDFDRDAREWESRVPGMIVSRWRDQGGRR